MSPVFRRFAVAALAVAVTAAAAWPGAARAQSQEQQPAKPAPPPVEEEKRRDQLEKTGKTIDLGANKSLTAEGLAEAVVIVYGNFVGRALLAQVRRSGVERGRTVRATADGRNEEITYEYRFVRGENLAKDKIRLDQKMPSMEYALVYNEGRVWGVINDTAFTPREKDRGDFLSPVLRGIDALLRYKENGSKVAYVGTDKQKNIDLWVLDLTDKEGRKTRYYVSANPDLRLRGRVLWLEYEEPAAEGGEPVKYKRTFHEYRYAQGTLVPFRSVLFANGKQVEETRILNVSYGIKMDDAVFKSPEAAAN
jgi:hypothetical protein